LPELELIVSRGECREADVSYEDWCAASSTEPPQAVSPSMSDAHEIIYTSGTTGDPKGVIWSHGTVLWNNTQQIIDFGIHPGDSNYVALDLNYIGGRHDFTMAMLQQGGTVHLRASGGFDAAQILRYLADQQISHVLWVPTMLYDVLQQTELLTDLDTSALKMIMCGGSPLSEEMIRRAQSAFPHTDFVQVFGLTEGGGTPTFVPKHRLLDKIGSAGLPSIFNEIRIMAAEGTPCPPGEVGEIQVRGPAVTPGYWGNPEASSKLVEDGWLHTGDLGRRDEEGFLFVAGRARDLIISGGMNIFPADVEHVISEVDGVEQVSVVGLPDERWGETVCAVVRLSAGASLTAEDIIAHCRDRLASYKKPTSVAFVEEFPVTVSGKIRKNVLVEQLQSDREGVRS
jgi:fatty-acyl-CoA synthase